MSELRSLLAPEQRAILEQVQVDLFHSQIPEPVMGVDIVEINGCQIDLRGDATHVAVCAECNKTTEVEIAPEGVDLSVPRTVRCKKCTKATAKAEAKALGVIRVPKTAKHKPRVTDGIDHPVEVRTKEEGMTFDFNRYTPAQLAVMIDEAHDTMRAKIEAAMPANVMAALAGRKEAEQADIEQMQAERETRKGLVLPGFKVGKIEVPALDLSDVRSMDDIVPSTMRSPYNKALFSLGLPILAGGTPDEIGTKATLATYALVAKVHERLSQPDADHAVKVAKRARKAAKKQGKVEVVVAEFEPETPAMSERAQALVEAAALAGKTLSPEAAEQMAGAL